MRRLYKSRRDVLLEALEQQFGDRVTVRGDAAGMHLTVRFRAGTGVRAAAQRNGVQLAGTGMYYLAEPVPDEFILGFSAIGERTIRESVRRLALHG
jgi:GntR family transcriptional regulator/MocR family aminotransferase